MSETAPLPRTDPPGPTDVVVGLDPFAPGFFDDPYAQYAVLREHAPLHRSALGPCVLTRYADCVRVLRDPSLSVEDRHANGTVRLEMLEAVEGVDPEQMMQRGSRAILNIDPPDHTRLRRIVSKAFTPKMVEGLRPRAAVLVDEALDRLAAAGGGDLVAEFAYPLPFTIITEMLGMPPGDEDDLREWSHTLAKTLDPILTPDEVRAAFDASTAMRDKCLEAIGWKRQHPADDLLTALVHAEDGGDVLTEHELIDQVILLYIAGHETTVNLIGNGTHALLRHPDQLARLRQDPGLDVLAVEECLRWDSPVQFSRRITLTELEIHGEVIEPGAFVLTCLGSANRDPAEWGDDADRFDVGREDARKHISFGSGVHHCLGAALARVEGQEALGRLVRRFNRIDLAGEPRRNGRIVLRGLDTLPLTLA